MAESDWLLCRDPAFLLKRATWLDVRKLRLFGVACCRAVPGGFADAVAWQAVEVAERFADGRAMLSDLEAAHRALPASVPHLRWAFRDQPLTRASAERDAADGVLAWIAPEWSSARFIRVRVTAAVLALSHCNPAGTRPSVVHAAQADLVRDVAGNPYRPAAFAPEWRTSAAVGVADAVYAGRTFHDLPILADALQDAGCDDAAILDHLRGPGPHARGCWVLDLVLGRA